MSFGGGSPGMSILVGVAKAVSEDDKRRREIEQEAINKRLKEQQITQMQESSELNRQREQRYRDTEIARQEEVGQVRADAEVRRAQEDEHKQLLTGLVAEQIQREEDVDAQTALQMATLHMEGAFQYETPEPEEEASWGERQFWYEQNIEQDMAADMERIFGNTVLSNQLLGAQNVAEVHSLTEEYNAQNGTDFSPEAARGLWQEVNASALDPESEYGKWEDMPSHLQSRVSDEANVRSGKALLEAEQAIAKWKNNNQPAEGEEQREWDPYDIAQSIIANEIRGQAQYGNTTPYRQAVMDRMLFELERLRQEDDSGGGISFNEMTPRNQGK